MLKLLLHLAIALQLSAPCIGYAETENWRSRESADTEVTASDIAAEISLGRAIAAKIFGKYISYDSPKLIEYVNLVGNALTLNINRPELEFHFTILDTDEVNSYAAPGGYVFITKGALEFMADESELAGVLAYEIAHISQKDVVRELNIRGSDEPPSFAKLISGASGAIRAALQIDKNTTQIIKHSDIVVDKGFDLIYRDTYKTEDKFHADRTSILISTLGGYDPAGLIRFLARIKQTIENIPDKPNHITQALNTRISHLKDAIANEDFGHIEFSQNIIRFTDAMEK